MIPIIVDTREQQPWSFLSDDFIIKRHKLNVGDYSIVGCESTLCIERKKSVAEIAQNIVSKRFFKELERMRNIRFKFIICEFAEQTIEDYPFNLKLPQKVISKIRVRGKFIRMKLHQIHEKYGVGIVFAGDAYHAEEIATNLIRRIYGLYYRE
jgi:ERCC4-type nuclease